MREKFWPQKEPFSTSFVKMFCFQCLTEQNLKKSLIKRKIEYVFMTTKLVLLIIMHDARFCAKI